MRASTVESIRLVFKAEENDDDNDNDNDSKNENEN